MLKSILKNKNLNGEQERDSLDGKEQHATAL